jgi:hypothetical protein
LTLHLFGVFWVIARNSVSKFLLVTLCFSHTAMSNITT